MVILGDFAFLTVGSSFLDLTLAAVVAAAAAAGKVFVGVQADPEQPVDFTAFQSLVLLEGFDAASQALAQILCHQPPGDIAKKIVTDGTFEMAQPPPAPPLGLLGQIQIAGNPREHPQEQAEQHGQGFDLSPRPPVVHRAQPGLQVEDFLHIVQSLGQTVHGRVCQSSPRRNIS